MRKNSISKRCAEDTTVQMRLSFNLPFYWSFEKQVGSHVWSKGRELIMLCSNDYLGLTHHPKILEAGARAMKQWGSSTTGARSLNGSRDCHEELEARLAAFLGKEACQVFSAGYLACMASVAAFAQRGDLIVVDRNAHSSLASGIRLTQLRSERFGHNNPNALRELLETESPEHPKMLVMEGVYSMEGHIVKLNEFLELAEAHNCFVVVDDAHGLGVLGEGGRGTVNHFQANDKVDIITGSFSKALASTGGFVAGDKQLIEYLRTHSKQAIFTAALSPAQVACTLAALDIIENEPEHLIRLWENTRTYKTMLTGLGFDLWESETPAVPIIMGDKVKTYYAWKQLYLSGIFTGMAITPAVPPRKDLIRTAISARHTQEDLEKIADVFAALAKEFSETEITQERALQLMRVE